MSSNEPLMPGLYHWMRDGEILKSFCVNFPNSESELKSIAAERLPNAPESILPDGSLASQSGWLSVDYPLCPWLIALGILWLIFELCLCRPRKERSRA